MRYLRHIFLLFFIAAVPAVSPITTKAAQTDFMGSGSTDGTAANGSQSNDAAGSTGGGNSNSAYPGFSTSSSATASIISSDQQSALSQNAKLTNDPRAKAIQDSTVAVLMKKKSSFQNYIESSTGHSLDIFGKDLFRSVPSTFAPLQNTQVNSDYVIGPGDVLQIKGWGMVDIDVTATVNRSGAIYLKSVGSVQVAGVRYRDLQGYLHKAIGRIFRNFQLTTSIVQTRSVQVYVVGNAIRPGSYTLSSMSTLLNALFASGGPSVTGSLRNIKLKRGGAPLVTFDLYDMLLYGDKSSDAALQDGDVIYIPPVGPQIALYGDVKNAAIFELKQKSSIADAVTWAGGFDSAADLKQVIVQKNVDSQFQTVAELQADWSSIAKNLSQLDLQPSDIIRVFSPSSAPLEVKIHREFVRVDGEVNHNGVFELEHGETLRHLLTRIGGGTEKSYVYGIRLNRESVRKAQQAKIDESIDRFERDSQANNKQQLTSTDPLQAAAASSQSQVQMELIKKLKQVKSEGRIILSLKNSNAGVEDLPEFPLKDGDRVYIPERPLTVDVIGAVYQPNTFIFSPRKSVKDYLVMAGGVSPTGERPELYRICADGTVNAHNHSSSKVNPGDAIVIPERLQRGPGLLATIGQFTSILYQLGLGAAGLSILKNL